MVKNDLNFERLIEAEDPENPMITIVFKQTKGRHLAITAVYRQWKAPGELEPNNAHGITRQCRRMKVMAENFEKIASKGFDMVAGGDFNIDRHQPNDPCSRPELRALTPLFEDMLIKCDLHQLNKKPTRHMVGQRSSLLDLFLSNIPQRISNLENILNTTSEP